MPDLSWTPPDYTVDRDGRVQGRKPPTSSHNWGRWGQADERGTANLLDAAGVVQAAKLISTGHVFSLALPLDAHGPVHPERSGVVHLYAYAGSDFVVGSEINRRFPGFQGSDDYVFMPLQGSTQWDAFAHCAYEDTIYNGFWAGTVESYGGARRGSIHHLSETMVGRGVLLDVARMHGLDRLPPGHAISGQELTDCAQFQGVTVESGDMLLVRTGHVAWWYELADKAIFWRAGAPGMGRDSVEWLHEHDRGCPRGRQRRGRGGALRRARAGALSSARALPARPGTSPGGTMVAGGTRRVLREGRKVHLLPLGTAAEGHECQRLTVEPYSDQVSSDAQGC